MWFNILKTSPPETEQGQNLMSIIHNIAEGINQMETLPKPFNHAFPGDVGGSSENYLTFNTIEELRDYVSTMKRESIPALKNLDDEELVGEVLDIWLDLAIETNQMRLVEELTAAVIRLGDLDIDALLEEIRREEE